MSIATVTSKGQIAIPARIRRRFGIEKGTRLYIEERGEEIVLKPLTAEYIDRTAGILKSEVSLTGKLLQERAAHSVQHERKGYSLPRRCAELTRPLIHRLSDRPRGAPARHGSCDLM